MNKPRINPYLAVLVGVIAVSFSSLFVKVSTASPIMIATYRILFTFLMLAPFALLNKNSGLWSVSFKDRALAALSGLFLALHFITWFTSLNYTSVASSVVIVTTQAIWVVIGSYFLFKEKVPPAALVGVAMALGGSIYIGATDLQLGMRALWGDLLALLGAILVSCYFLIGRLLRSRVNTQAYTFYTYGTGTLVMIVTSLFFKLKFYPYPISDWLAFFGLAAVCTIMGHTVFNWSLKYIPASAVTVAVLGEPIGAVVLSALFIKEIPSVRQLLGGLIIITGIYIFLTRTYKSEDRRKSVESTGTLN